MRPLYTAEDFDASVWDAMCEARYKKRMDHWYRLLRQYAGYKTGSHMLLKHLESECDTWIEAHPTWCKQRDRELLFGWLST